MADTGTKISAFTARTAAQMLGTELFVLADGAGGTDNWKMVGSQLVTYASSGVQANLDAHEADLTNPHNVTAAQAGADASGSAAAVQSNLDTHEALVIAATGTQAHGLLNNGDGSKYLNDDGGYTTVTKAQVGLSNVDNTSDAAKPVSTAQQTAIDAVQTNLDTHEAEVLGTNQPHSLLNTGDGSKYLSDNGTYTAPAGSGAVDSVFGRTGTVVAAANDYDIAKIQGMTTAGGGTNFLADDGTYKATPAGAVDSVFGRTGVVVATAGDYDGLYLEGDNGLTNPEAGELKITGTATKDPMITITDDTPEDQAQFWYDQTNGGVRLTTLQPTGADIFLEPNGTQKLFYTKAGGAEEVATVETFADWPTAPLKQSDEAAAADGDIPSGGYYRLDNGVGYTLRQKK